MKAHHLSHDAIVDLDDRCPAAFGTDATGAALIRPDGIPAWRSELNARPSAQTLAAVHLIARDYSHSIDKTSNR